MTAFQEHVARWKDCTKCKLCNGRRAVIFARGRLPCDILFVGEAPGPSENALGTPFIGPAGKLLDQIIETVVPEELRICFTNLVGCFPKEEKEAGKNEPPLEAIKACELKLKEFVRIAKPKLIAMVGNLAKKHIHGQAQFCNKNEDTHPPWIPKGKFLEFIHITHPSAILQANISQRGLLIQKVEVILAEAVEQLVSNCKLSTTP